MDEPTIEDYKKTLTVYLGVIIDLLPAGLTREQRADMAGMLLHTKATAVGVIESAMRVSQANLAGKELK